MSSIYRLSIITIAAANSVADSDGHRGCFSRTRYLSIRRCWEITPHWPEKSLSPTALQIFSPPTPSYRDAYQGVAESRAIEAEGLYELQSRSWSSNCAGHCIATFNSSISPNFNLQYVPKRQQGPTDKLASQNNPSNTNSNIFVRRRVPHPYFISHDTFNQRFRQGQDPIYLYARAWAYQERLLATRVLHYTFKELLWECKTTTARQCRLIDQMDFRKQFRWRKTLKVYFEDRQADAVSVEELIAVWGAIVFHYSVRFLSHPSDRLTALSGLAKRLQERGLLGDYVAGLWSRHLDHRLCWKVPDRPAKCKKFYNRPPGYVAPTWSWASLRDGTDGIFPVWWITDEDAGQLSLHSTIVGKVLDVNCTSKGLDPTGAVSDGNIMVTGQIIETVLHVSGRNLDRPQTINAAQEYYSVISLDSDSESGSWPTCSSEIEDGDIGEPPYGPYSYIIKHEPTYTEHFFIPDSVSDLGISKDKYAVTLLLWSVQDWPIALPGPGGPLAFACFVLKSVKAREIPTLA